MTKGSPVFTPTDIEQIRTLGQLKAAGYQTKSIKDELRQNLIARLKSKSPAFPGILGYDETVIPDLQRAILSKHHILLLGLRGQAKTRIARQMADLLDEYIPYIEGTDLLDDPLNPVSYAGHQILTEQGDKTPIAWLHRSERYTEKLATPDVSVADLIGDVDPIKAATLKLPYSDPRVLHYGLVPRSNRCLFVINELPDLQARIQVALFNILQEGDIQIRGFKLRLPLDIQFVFTANPEDYTNRGSIVTPLKDRIDSQIITHYPQDLAIGKAITQQEAQLSNGQHQIQVPDLARDLIEQVAFEARDSEFVDSKSGVSARLTISAYENLLSSVERRMLLNQETEGTVRVSDMVGVIPSITGKIELVYEGEQEGAGIVAQNLLGKATRSQFVKFFPDPKPKKEAKATGKADKTYKAITDWFSEGHTLDLMLDATQSDYHQVLSEVPGLKAIVEKHQPTANGVDQLFMMEFVLHGLAEYSMLSKKQLQRSTQFGDLLSSMFSMPAPPDFDEEDEEEDF